MQANTHDPYRSRSLIVPQFEGDPADVTPVDHPVRVLAVVDRYPPWIHAGAEWMLHSIFRDLKTRGHDVMVSTHLPADAEIPTIVDGVPVYPYEMADQLATAADVMVGHLLWTREVVSIAKQHKLPLIYLLHNDRQIGHWNLAAHNVTVLVPNSEWVKRRTVDQGWSGPMFVCRPPVFVDDYRLDPKEHDPEFVTLINMTPEKGALQFYDLSSQLHRKKFLAVEGGYGHQHRPQRWHGNVTWQKPTANIRDDVYRRTKILLVPSEYESWGRVAVEAMAAGIPVIAHPTPGLVEACGDAAVFADRTDLGEWVRWIQAFDNPETWRWYSHAGQRRADDLEAITNSDLTVFDEWVRRCAVMTPGSAARIAGDAEEASSGSRTATGYATAT